MTSFMGGPFDKLRVPEPVEGEAHATWHGRPARGLNTFELFMAQYT